MYVYVCVFIKKNLGSKMFIMEKGRKNAKIVCVCVCVCVCLLWKKEEKMQK